MIIRKDGCVIAVTALLILVAAAGAEAHRVNIFAYSEGGRVHTESFFPDGKPAVNSDISITGVDGEVILEGRTDEEGLFSFTPTVHDDLLITVYAGQGHKAEYLLKKSELPDAADKDTKGIDTENDSLAPDDRADGATGNISPANNAGHAGDARVIEALRQEIEHLEQRNKLLKEKLESEKRKEHHTPVTMIIGGIGYILGIMGIWMFAVSKKTK